jgi:MFS family permease
VTLLGLSRPWRVVLGGSVLLMLQNGLILSAFGAYLVAITADTGWSPGIVAVGYAIVQLGNGFLAPLTGWCCDRFGTRAVSRVGTFSTAAGFALASGTADAPQFIAAIMVVALGCSAAGIMPLTVAVVQALPERRTLALGLLPSGIALGGLAVPFVALALDGIGWRATFLVVAGVIVLVGLAAGATLPTARAGARGVPAVAADEPVPAAAPAAAGHDLGSALRTSAFWLLVAGHGSALVAVSAVNLHLVPLLTHHHGMPLATAGVAVAAMSVAQLVGQVVTGLIGDKIDKRTLAASCMAVQTGVLVLMATVSGFAMLVTAAVVHGLMWGLRGPVMTSLRTDYFGLASFGTIMGWSMGFVSLGLVIGPLLVSALADGPGYQVAFLTLAAVTGAGGVAFVVLRAPRPATMTAARPVACGCGDTPR